MTQTEDRLRAAFTARAAQVTYADLRRAEPPGGRSWGARRVRRIAYAVVGAAAAVAAVLLLALGPGKTLAPAPVLPARPPHTTPQPERPATPGPVPAPAVSPGSPGAPGSPQRP